MKNILFTSVALLSLMGFASTASAGPVRSAAVLEFADEDTLFVADWRGGEIHAFDLPATSVAAAPFNVMDVRPAIARRLGVRSDALRIEDMAVRPGSGLAYVALSVVRGERADPAIVSVTPQGQVEVLNLRGGHVSAPITDRPAAEDTFWRDVPAQSLTITDMTFYEGRLYVAGIGNREFASTLRIFDYPFAGAGRSTTVEIYHAVHNQIETRAPIRTMDVVLLNGVRTLLAAYTCTPLVTIPLSDLRDGAHIRGRTIAELGYGNAPIDMVTYTSDNQPMVLISNTHRGADLMTLASIAEGAVRPSLSTPIVFPTEPLAGVRAASIPLGNIDQMADYNDGLILTLRRDPASGAVQMVTLPKAGFLRLSDFVNEYDFEGYNYEQDIFRPFHVQLRELEGYPELADRAR